MTELLVIFFSNFLHQACASTMKQCCENIFNTREKYEHADENVVNINSLIIVYFGSSSQQLENVVEVKHALKDSNFE